MLYKYFPLGVAEDKAFLGREAETSILTRNIDTGVHTLLMAPRRFGKSSLARHVIKKTNILYAEIDLFLAADKYSIEHKILRAVRILLSKLSSPQETIVTWLGNYFKKMKKHWTISFSGVSLELIPEQKEDVPENILEALDAVEHILSKSRQKAVLFIDEFQEITKLKETKAIEGAIRNFAQRSKHLTFIFSGSNRHLLGEMFFDRARPFYELCDVIQLDRIPKQLYVKYLKQVSKRTWGKVLADDVIDEILALTERHPYRVYDFCKTIWDHCANHDKSLTKQEVIDIWNKYIFANRKSIRAMLTRQSIGKLKLLTLISFGYTTTLTSRRIQRLVNLSGSAITQNLSSLAEEDMIEKTPEGEYHVIDPLIKWTLQKYNNDYFVDEKLQSLV